MNIEEYMWISIEKKLSINVQKYKPNKTQDSNIKINETCNTTKVQCRTAGVPDSKMSHFLR